MSVTKIEVGQKANSRINLHMNNGIQMNDFVDRLTAKYKNIKSIWLYGSRANENANETSDWDLMVFGDQLILESLKTDRSFYDKKIDLLIVINSDDYASPYDVSKNGSLTNLEWKIVAVDKATYWGYDKKDFQSSSKGFDLIRKNAIRIFPKN